MTATKILSTVKSTVITKLKANEQAEKEKVEEKRQEEDMEK